MVDLEQIEELFKNEEFAKAVNRHALDMLFRNTKMLEDPNITPEMKEQALANIKAITSGEALPKPKRAKKPKAEKPAVAPVQKPVVQAAAAPVPTPVAQPKPKLEMPAGLHLSPLNTGGHDEAGMRSIFDSLPDEHKQQIIDIHSATKMKKSVARLCSLFRELKKRL